MVFYSWDIPDNPTMQDYKPHVITPGNIVELAFLKGCRLFRKTNGKLYSKIINNNNN